MEIENLNNTISQPDLLDKYKTPVNNNGISSLLSTQGILSRNEHILDHKKKCQSSLKSELIQKYLLSPQWKKAWNRNRNKTWKSTIVWQLTHSLTTNGSITWPFSFQKINSPPVGKLKRFIRCQKFLELVPNILTKQFH